MKLDGYKTIVIGWVTALIPIAGMLGYTIDPEAVTQFINDSWAWIAAGQVGLGAAIQWARNLSKG